jgi:hypothetical protein
VKGLLTCAKLSPVGDSVDHKPRWNSDLQTSWAIRVCSLRDSLARELSKRAGKKDITLGGGKSQMTPNFRVLAAGGALLMALSGADAAFAQKPGGVLTVYNWDNPPSLSIHEEITNATLVPMMGVSNNLVMYKQDEA